MRAEVLRRRGFPTLVVSLAFGLTWARAETPRTALAEPEPPAPSATPGDADRTLQRALELERRKRWSDAIRVYEEALELWPSKTEFSRRLRLCESHERLIRRYQDRSFRQTLLSLPKHKCMEVFDELIERIGSHYVFEVPLEPLVRRGLDNLEVALRDPNFVRVNAPRYSAERAVWLRQALRARRDRLSVNNAQDAANEVLTACDLATKGVELNPAAVVLEFIYGACEALDPYTSYLTPDKLEDMFAMIDGNFVGLGVELKQDEQGLRLVAVIRGGPAHEAGIKVGDRIIEVDHVSIKGLGLDESASKLQGIEGSIVEVVILQPDGKSRSIKLSRRHVEVESVTQAKLVDRELGAGYIRMTGFQKSTTEELDRAIADLTNQGMKSLILDLRGNPGGLLNIAVEIADKFLDDGIIVATRGRAPGQTQVYRAKEDVPYPFPLTVLIDHDSASASEILAGALKELGRAKLVGDRSYGKGSVQSIFELHSVQTGLKLTTAQFYSPTNRPYSEQGVQPDILVRDSRKPSRYSDAWDESRESRIGELEQDPVLARAVELTRRESRATSGR